MGLIIALSLIVIGYFYGSSVEKKHFQSIKEREKKFRSKPAMSGKTGLDSDQVQGSGLVSGSVVISIDRFKQVMGTLRSMFGGEVHAYGTLLDRGRREAILRMKESSPQADMFVNLKIETSRISTSAKGGGVGTVEVCAYATAVKIKA